MQQTTTHPSPGWTETPASAASAAAGEAFVYVCGCPRSGTYLFQMLMNRAFSIAFPAETHFMPAFARYGFLWGDLNRPENRRRLLDAIYDFAEIFTHTVLWTRTDLPADTDRTAFTLLSTRPGADQIVAGATTLGGLVDALFRDYAGRHGARRWGDKTAFYDPVPVDSVVGSLPDTKVIHVIRDGRDACLSWMKTWHGPATVIESARLWARHVEEKRAWGRRHPDRYLEVRYEDLIDAVEDELDRVAAFLGEARAPGPVDLGRDEMSKLIGTLDSHTLLTGGVRRDNKEKWRSAMSDADLRDFETVAGDTLAACGYTVVHGRAGRRAIFPLANVWARLRRYVRPVYWKRLVKNHLPLLIRGAQATGFPLVRVLTRADGRS